MSDLISRQAAIDALSHMMDTDGFRDGWAVSRANVDCMLRYLPSVEPERKLGIWTHEDAGAWICGVCGEEVGEMGDEYGVPKYNFCPYCGADMTGRR